MNFIFIFLELLHRIREMVSFGLGKEIEKDVFLSCHELGTKKKILSPHKELNLRPESKGLRFDSSWGLRIFFLCPTLVTR